MRLICPNCGAQYDVADDAIPAGGRDVQCSSCNHTWFQTEKKFAPAPDLSVPEPAPRQEPQPARKPVDPSISDILREEAAREQQLRAPSTSSPPKTQEDTTPKPAIDAEETRKRIAQMTEAEGGVRIAPAPKPTETGTVAASRVEPAPPRVVIPELPEEADTNPRDMPGMNEINTSLRARSQTTEPQLTPEEEQEVVKRRGFRRGFVFVLLVFAILFAPYVFADQITQTFPPIQDTMASYVANVDQLRLRLDQVIGTLGDTIAGFTAADEPVQN
ncbi:zinc-ribbon domain-containing protein [Yoonia vestfoldensis]|uniref:zinc-ribbon domain-containing protein n=1 Tax=Yoonia vestfoldensis TaxID=245188 RepID=UPI0003A46ED8|nr:zinc-ribbon domain-containing protein [Yoonia vestfoldensis]